MIITCEQCHARYLLASLLLGVHGRKVRCGVCSHTWFQEPIDEISDNAVDVDPPELPEPATEAPESFAEMMDAEAVTVEPIPDGVRPVEDTAPETKKRRMPSFKIPGLKWAMTPGDVRAVMASILLFLLIGGGLIVMRTMVVQIWPPSALLYEVTGLKIPVPGEGLIFDRVKASAVADSNGTSTLTVEGAVINLRAQKSALPRIRATLLGDGGLTETSWIIPVSENEIAPETTIPFTATFTDVPESAKEVNVRFVLN